MSDIDEKTIADLVKTLGLIDYIQSKPQETPSCENSYVNMASSDNKSSDSSFKGPGNNNRWLPSQLEVLKKAADEEHLSNREIQAKYFPNYTVKRIQNQRYLMKLRELQKMKAD